VEPSQICAGNYRKGFSLDSRSVGKFILWAVITAVGWSFYSTMKHETGIAVINQHLGQIDKRLEKLEK
jgi:hypothetical protein